jgi:hypothetical protein
MLRTAPGVRACLARTQGPEVVARQPLRSCQLAMRGVTGRRGAARSHDGTRVVQAESICNRCLETFAVTIGTLMEWSRVPLSKWALAFPTLAANKRRMSVKQLQRELNLGSYRTACFHAASTSARP